MKSLIDLVAPTRCVACAQDSDGDLCEACAGRVRIVDAARPDRPAAFRRARSLVVFAEPARALTLAVKRRGSRTSADAMGALLAALARREGLDADVVTFVPARRAAAVDHARLIATAVARDLGVPVAGLLRRRGDGPRQSDVKLDARWSNVARRFAARRARGRVLLVDDVFTTGSTAEACARALLAAGADQVDVLTWAMTPLRGNPRSLAILRR